jgi:hypothetical protein
MSVNAKFWGVCVPVRLAIAVVVCLFPNRWLPFAGAVALIGAIGLIFRTLTYSPAQLSFFKHKVYWNNLRPVHAFMWLVFAFLAFEQDPRAKIIPFIDVVFGAIAREHLHA